MGTQPMTDIERADHIAADLVGLGYGQLGVLACVVRMEGENVRVIAPDGHCKPLPLMLYRIADTLAEHAGGFHNVNLRD